jgi:hypothetical protein
MPLTMIFGQYLSIVSLKPLALVDMMAISVQIYFETLIAELIRQ